MPNNWTDITSGFNPASWLPSIQTLMLALLCFVLIVFQSSQLAALYLDISIAPPGLSVFNAFQSSQLAALYLDEEKIDMVVVVDYLRFNPASWLPSIQTWQQASSPDGVEICFNPASWLPSIQTLQEAAAIRDPIDGFQSSQLAALYLDGSSTDAFHSTRDRFQSSQLAALYLDYETPVAF